MQDILTKLITLLDSTDTQYKQDAEIASVIWHCLQQGEQLRIEAIAAQTNKSPATINRFAKKYGFSGFLPLKKAILQAWEANKQSEIKMSRGAYERFANDHREILRYNFDLVRQGIEQTQKILTIEPLEQAVRLFGVANAIHFIGIDYSHLVAKDAQQKFMRLGKMCTAYHDLERYQGRKSIFAPGDLVVIFSFSGQSAPGQEVAQSAKAKGLQIVVITADPMSPLAQVATHLIQIAGQENAFTDSSTSGRLILHTVMDTLYLLYGTINNKNLVITE